MKITPAQMLEVLNLRAQGDPLIREILRSTMYEVAVGELSVGESVPASSVEEEE